VYLLYVVTAVAIPLIWFTVWLAYLWATAIAKILAILFANRVPRGLSVGSCFALYFRRRALEGKRRIDGGQKYAIGRNWRVRGVVISVANLKDFALQNLCGFKDKIETILSIFIGSNDGKFSRFSSSQNVNNRADFHRAKILKILRIFRHRP
jgi:hypothetical protein